jgi:hypothetical protein
MITEWLVVVAVAIYLHAIYWFRRRYRAAGLQVDFLRRIGARDSDSIVLFWAFGASLAAIVLLFIPFSSDDPRSLYMVFTEMLSGRAVDPLPDPTPIRSPGFLRLGWWIVPFAAGTYLFLVWSYRLHFRWAEAQMRLIRRLLNISADAVVLVVSLALISLGFAVFVFVNSRP